VKDNTYRIYHREWSADCPPGFYSHVGYLVPPPKGALIATFEERGEMEKTLALLRKAMGQVPSGRVGPQFLEAVASKYCLLDGGTWGTNNPHVRKIARVLYEAGLVTEDEVRDLEKEVAQ